MPRSAEFALHDPVNAEPPILVCLFGAFRLFKHGLPVMVRSGGQTEALLGSLALSLAHGVPREALTRRSLPIVTFPWQVNRSTALSTDCRKDWGTPLAAQAHPV